VKDIPDRTHGGRLLIYFPIIHTQADLGALGELVQRIKIRRLGRRAWSRNVHLVDQLWTRIEESIAGLNLHYERVRIYQDGLPDSGHELEIVAELAKAGSRNHRLLLQLHEKGAKIMGTESPELLIEEYQLMTQDLAGNLKPRAGIAASQMAKSDILLAQRDQHIAKRINSTLEEGETGILFLGMLHSLSTLLAKDIRLVFPVDLSSRHGGGSR
jgi:hypothetical protein